MNRKYQSTGSLIVCCWIVEYACPGQEAVLEKLKVEENLQEPLRCKF